MAGKPSTPRSVFIVDDDAHLRESLDDLLRSCGFVTRTFASAEALLSAARWPDCLVLDVGLPGLNGLELQDRLAAAGASIPIVFITAQGTIPMTVRAMRAGAVEFLAKPFEDEELLQGVERAIARGDASRTLRDAHESLSSREREVLTLIVNGLLNKQIAAQFGTTEATVKKQRGRLMKKMGATSLAELVQMAGHLGIHRQK